VLTKAANKGYSKAVNIWSLGVILYTMYAAAAAAMPSGGSYWLTWNTRRFRLAGARPFEETKETTIFSAIKSGKYRFPDNPWKTISEEGTYSRTTSERYSEPASVKCPSLFLLMNERTNERQPRTLSVAC